MSVGAPFGGDVLLADTSVWRRADRLPSDIADEWERALVNNQIALSPVIVFELLARATQINQAIFDEWHERLSQVPRVLIPDGSIWALAQEVYVESARRSQLTALSMTDIIVAATAAVKNVPVLHLDKDYEQLQALDCIEFKARRIVPPGTQI